MAKPSNFKLTITAQEISDYIAAHPTEDTDTEKVSRAVERDKIYDLIDSLGASPDMKTILQYALDNL